MNLPDTQSKGGFNRRNSVQRIQENWGSLVSGVLTIYDTYDTDILTVHISMKGTIFRPLQYVGF